MDRIEEDYKTFVSWYVWTRHDCFGWGNSPQVTSKMHEFSAKGKFEHVVTPEAIELFLYQYNRHSEDKPYLKEFSTALVNNAYDGGHNGFVLPASKDKHDEPPYADLFGGYWYLQGKKKDLLDITIKGESFQEYGHNLNYAKVRFVAPEVMRCGYYCKNSVLIFESETIKGSAFMSENCDIYLYGTDVSNSGMVSKNNRFFSPHKSTLEKVSEEAGSGSSFYLIEEDGSHTEVKF